MSQDRHVRERLTSKRQPGRSPIYILVARVSRLHTIVVSIWLPAGGIGTSPMGEWVKERAHRAGSFLEMWTIYVLRISRVLLFASLCLVLNDCRAMALDTPATNPGIWWERRSSNAISGRHEQQLISSLVRITGFCDLHFARDGELSLGDTSHVMGGAAVARHILLTVLSSHDAFVIEDCSGSDDINFGQVVVGTVFQNAGMRINIWRVQIDFNDFRHVQAPPEVRASFDEGFILLHELLHGIGYADASGREEIGQCEETVNQARSELGLPLRDHYFVAPRRVTDTLASARIRFRSQAGGTIPSREELHYLYFVMKTESGYPAGIRSAAERRR